MEEHGAEHGERMRALVAFTSKSLDTPFPSPFGSAVYDAASGLLLAQACDTVMRDCDPTCHAEVNAIRVASRKLNRLSLRGCVLYSTCEPCPMCMSASIWAELDGVVFGASTMEDADRYWPQGSDLAPEELISRARFEPRSFLLRHIEREACRELFRQCDAVRQANGMDLPPRRTA